MKERLIPSAGRLVVKPDPHADRTEGGLYYADTTKARERPTWGVVLALGEGCETTNAVAGDTVVYEFAAGNTVGLKGAGEVVVLKAEDVLAVVVED